MHAGVKGGVEEAETLGVRAAATIQTAVGEVASDAPATTDAAAVSVGGSWAFGGAAATGAGTAAKPHQRADYAAPAAQRVLKALRELAAMMERHGEIEPATRTLQLRLDAAVRCLGPGSYALADSSP